MSSGRCQKHFSSFIEFSKLIYKGQCTSIIYLQTLWRLLGFEACNWWRTVKVEVSWTGSARWHKHTWEAIAPSLERKCSKASGQGPCQQLTMLDKVLKLHLSLVLIWVLLGKPSLKMQSHVKESWNHQDKLFWQEMNCARSRNGRTRKPTPELNTCVNGWRGQQAITGSFHKFITKIELSVPHSFLLFSCP